MVVVMTPTPEWENITLGRPCRESEGFIVAMKRLIPVEQRDPTLDVFT